MLQVSSMSYNASATSVDSNNNILAYFNFNADTYANYNFSITYRTVDAVSDADVATDFNAFKDQVVAIIEDDIAPYAQPTTATNPDMPG